MGIYTLSLITGGHIAPIAGGYIVKNTLTWHWCFYIPAIITAFMLPLFIFTVPETLYSHSAERAQRPYGSWMENMTMRGRAHSTRSLKIVDFFRPIQMLMYPSVLLPTLYYSVSFGYGSILFIITSANLFLKVYKYQPYQTGVLLGVPLTVGSVIGELVAGGVSDWISEKRALARNGERKPEDRLLALFPAIVLLPLGIIIEGVCLTHKLHAIGTGFGIAIASFGLQIATTVVYTYTAEVSLRPFPFPYLHVLRSVLTFITVLQTASSRNRLPAQLWPSNLWLLRRLLRGETGHRGRLPKCLDRLCLYQFRRVAACPCVDLCGRKVAACYGAARIPSRFVITECVYCHDCALYIRV